MNFKKPKEEVIEQAAQAAEWTFYYNMRHYLEQSYYNRTHYGYQHGPEELHNLEIMRNALGMAFRDALRVVVDSVYTDAEFEEDLGLKK